LLGGFEHETCERIVAIFRITDNFCVLVLIHLIAIPITNASVNPARSIASALFVGGWALQQLWLFIVAPIVGAVVAAAVYGALRAPIERISLTRAEESLPSEQLQRRNKPKAA